MQRALQEVASLETAIDKAQRTLREVVSLENAIDRALVISQAETSDAEFSDGLPPSTWSFAPGHAENAPDHSEEDILNAASAAAAEPIGVEEVPAVPALDIATEKASQTSAKLILQPSETGISLDTAEANSAAIAAKVKAELHKPCRHKCGRTRNLSTAYCCTQCPVQHTPQCEGRWKREQISQELTILKKVAHSSYSTAAQDVASASDALASSSSEPPEPRENVAAAPLKSKPTERKEQATQTSLW